MSAIKRTQYLLLLPFVMVSLIACQSGPASKKVCYHMKPEIEKQLGFCQAVLIGDTLHVSGVVGQGTMPEAIEGVYTTLGKVLADHDMNFSHVVKETIFVTDMDALIKNQDQRKAFYKGSFPASSWIGVERLYLPEFIIEVELTAVYSK